VYCHSTDYYAELFQLTLDLYVTEMLGVISDDSTKTEVNHFRFHIAAALWSKKVTTIFRLTRLQISDKLWPNSDRDRLQTC